MVAGDEIRLCITYYIQRSHLYLQALQAPEADDVKNEKRKYMTVDGGDGKETFSKGQVDTKYPSREEAVDQEANKDKTPVRFL